MSFFNDQVQLAKVDFSKSHGRGVFATQDIPSNTLLWSEKPFIHTVDSNFIRQLCFFCLTSLSKDGKLMKYLKCSDCDDVCYCSSLCKDLDKDLHRIECPIIVSLKPRVPTTQMRIQFRFIIETITNSSSLKQNIEELSTNRHSCPQDMIEFFKLCLILLERKGFRHLLGNISQDRWIDCFCMIRTNAIQLSIDEIQGHEKIGCGLFLLLSLVNHSCSGNVHIQLKVCENHSPLLMIFSSRNILKGEEILINYMDDIRKYQDRKKALKENYGFECDCENCQKKLDLLT